MGDWSRRLTAHGDVACPFHMLLPSTVSEARPFLPRRPYDACSWYSPNALTHKSATAWASQRKAAAQADRPILISAEFKDSIRPCPRLTGISDGLKCVCAGNARRQK